MAVEKYRENTREEGSNLGQQNNKSESAGSPDDALVGLGYCSQGEGTLDEETERQRRQDDNSVLADVPYAPHPDTVHAPTSGEPECFLNCAWPEPVTQLAQMVLSAPLTVLRGAGAILARACTAIGNFGEMVANSPIGCVIGFFCSS